MFSTISRALSGSSRKINVKFDVVKYKNMSSNPEAYSTLNVIVLKQYVYHVELNRPDKMNAINNTMWFEIEKCFQDLATNENCRVVILSGSGKIFSSGLDVFGAMKIATELSEKDDVARKAKILGKYIQAYQKSVSSLENCNKPVLAAIHSGCIGGGVDLVTAADIRYCTRDAWFQVKEVDLGMAADVGTLQRLPKVVGNDSLTRELCYTGRKFPAEEALSFGLVSKVFENKESMMNDLLKIAETIAQKSPVAVQGTKESLIYARDHSVQEGLNQICLWNKLMLQSEDFGEATMAAVSKNKDVIFSKL